MFEIVWGFSTAAACTLLAPPPVDFSGPRMRDNCVRLHSAAVGTSQRPICSRGHHSASATQLSHSSDQKFKSVDHLKSFLADSSPPQNEQQLTCAPSTEACHGHTENNDGNSTAELPHEASIMSISPQWKMREQSISFTNETVCETKAHKLATASRQTLLAKKQTNTAASHLTVQMMMPSPDATEHDISTRSRPAESNARWRERSLQCSKSLCRNRQ